MEAIVSLKGPYMLLEHRFCSKRGVIICKALGIVCTNSKRSIRTITVFIGPWHNVWHTVGVLNTWELLPLSNKALSIVPDIQ